jgi:phosphatidate cytidylyltransferase
MRRILTAIVLIPLVVALVLFGPPYLMVAVQSAIALAGVWEYFRLARFAGGRPLHVPGFFLAALLSLSPLKDSTSGGIVILLLSAGLMATMLIAMRPSEDLKAYVDSVAATLFGPIYVALPLALLVYVWMQYEGPHYVLFTLVVIWAGDTTAYFVGSSIGRHKCSPRISPNKTWEGTVASFAAALLVAAVASLWFHGGGVWWELLPLAAALNVAGQFGDLAESALKRSAGVKDSSNLIPGHGGVLDRIDALLFAAPVLWYYWTSVHRWLT